MSRVNRVKTN